MAHLTDTTSTLRAMAGGDPDLREAVSNASAVSASVKKIQGVETYCYEIEGGAWGVRGRGRWCWW